MTRSEAEKKLAAARKLNKLLLQSLEKMASQMASIHIGCEANLAHIEQLHEQLDSGWDPEDDENPDPGFDFGDEDDEDTDPGRSDSN
jgi:hypothetical protein